MRTEKSGGLWRCFLCCGLSILLMYVLSLGQAQAQRRDFQQTGKTIGGRFLEYWTAGGGITGFGLPISDQISERSDTNGERYTVQYFERAVFEMHPENARPHDVLLMHLGTFLYKQKHTQDAPNQRPNTAQGAQVFPQTGKRLGGIFRSYWEANGGLTRFGYPLSDEFTEKSALDGLARTVQYFERATFEHHPDKQSPHNILLAHLGVFRYQAKYASQSTTAPQNITLEIKEFRFHPREITVKVGTAVTWKQLDVELHNIASRDDWWASPLLEYEETYAHTFMVVGTYEYLCQPHPHMQGRVVVVP